MPEDVKPGSAGRRPRRRRKPVSVAPVPNAHFLMILITAVLIAVCLAIYPFVPGAKEALYVGVAGTLVGFLTGKLTNNYGKSLSLSPTVNAAEADDAEAEAEDEEGDGAGDPEGR